MPKPPTNELRPQTLRSLESKVAPAHTALLVTDMLNDFIDPRGKTATRANRPIEHARAAIPAQRGIIASARDVGAKVIFVNHTTLPGNASASGSWLEARSHATFSVEDICMDGSWGAHVIDELSPTADDLVVRKYRYSGFAGTNLDLILRSLGVRTVVCAGVSTNACVEATARDAFSLDYYVVYAANACASWDTDLHSATLATAAYRYAQVSDTADIETAWRST